MRTRSFVPGWLRSLSVAVVLVFPPYATGASGGIGAPHRTVGFGAGLSYWTVLKAPPANKWPGQAVYHLTDPAGLTAHFEYTTHLSSVPLAQTVYRLAYARLSTKAEDTSNGVSQWLPEAQRSESRVSGYILTPMVLIRMGTRHVVEGGAGITIGFLESQVTATMQEPFVTTKKSSTCVGLAAGVGYLWRLSPHVVWKVVAVEQRLFFNNDLGLPDFGSVFMIPRVGSEITVVP